MNVHMMTRTVDGELEFDDAFKGTLVNHSDDIKEVRVEIYRNLFTRNIVSLTAQVKSGDARKFVQYGLAIPNRFPVRYKMSFGELFIQATGE